MAEHQYLVTVTALLVVFCFMRMAKINDNNKYESLHMSF
jgi:hypothetical protein